VINTALDVSPEVAVELSAMARGLKSHSEVLVEPCDDTGDFIYEALVDQLSETCSIV